MLYFTKNEYSELIVDGISAIFIHYCHISFIVLLICSF